jgi:hypothetical protein
MKKVASAFLAIFMSTTASASELSIVGHGFSKHLDNHNFNEHNYGAALRLERNDFAVQAGGYHNSLRKDAFYAGVDYSPLHYNLGNCFKLDAGVYAGGATGYKYAVTPIVGVQAAVKCNDVFVRVRVMPDVFYNSKAVGAIELGIVLKKF